MAVLDSFNLHGRRALITGGSRGLGLEMARALGEAGAEVVIAGSSEDTLQDACRSLQDSGVHADAIQADLSQPEEAERLLGLAGLSDDLDLRRHAQLRREGLQHVGVIVDDHDP